MFVNEHNALFTQFLNVLPDWDMFQTRHEWAEFHAAARCVSGGPIYFTDEPGKHDMDLIRKMMATLTAGRTIILRPNRVGRTTEVYVEHREERLLRITAGHGDVQIMGVFNILQQEMAELVLLRHFYEIKHGRDYVVRKSTSGEVYGPFSSDQNIAVAELDLPPKGFEIFSAYPLLHTSDASIAVLGLVGKFSGAAAVLDVDIQTHNLKPMTTSVKILLKTLGTLGIYISTLSLGQISGI